MTIKYYSENEQKQKVQKGNPTLVLDHPCHINDGIVSIDIKEQLEFVRLFKGKLEEKDIQFFIPASGSGSRMFQFLFEFLNNPNDENRSEAEKFINRIQDFAFYNKIPVAIRKQFESEKMELSEFIEYLLFNESLDFGNSPKGLIPFHKSGDFILNPFQGQVLQGVKIAGEKSAFNFTIQKRYHDKIQDSINTLISITGKNPKLNFSEQNPNTDSFAFDEELKVAIGIEDNEKVMRPSGHGALLANLNEINADLLIIKNIDNLQHIRKAEDAIRTFQFLSGIAFFVQEKLFSAIEELNKGQKNGAVEIVSNLNKEFQLYHSSINLEELSDRALFNLLNRPTRVCGMVVNEGQPGGGPYWVKNKNQYISKQIVEKVQISKDKEQYYKMLKATHHNPVEIVCGLRDFEGKKFDLSEFSNEDLYFIVEKDQKGQKIKYVERPGLWNGSMDNWNTIFVEVESNTFSPVKTILDLLDPNHRE